MDQEFANDVWNPATALSHLLDASAGCGPLGMELQGLAGTANALKTESSVWSLGWAARGQKIEQALGHNLPTNFPVVDVWDPTKKLATSIKSVDLNAATYQDASK